MTKISKLADRFAMKLSLEPRPFIPSEDYKHTVEDIEPEYVPPEKFLSQRPNTEITDYLDLMRAGIHDIAQTISFGKFDDTIELIFDAQHNLRSLERVIKHKMKKKASIEDDDDDDSGTMFQSIEEADMPPKHLPSILKEYLKDLVYMDRDQLVKERKRLMHFVKNFAQQGHKPPYLLKMRLEEVDKLLLSESARWF